MNDHDAPVDERFTAAYWDERYGTAERIWSGAPNAQLVAEVTDLPPGTALDAGCGEGGDAHWLAARGWRPPRRRLGEVALRRAAAHAPAGAADGSAGSRPTSQPWNPEAVLDLGQRQFLHFPSALRTRVYARLAAAVAPGGAAADRRPRAVRAAHGQLRIFWGARPRARHVRHRGRARRRARPGSLGRCSSPTPARGRRRAGGRPGGPDLSNTVVLCARLVRDLSTSASARCTDVLMLVR